MSRFRTVELTTDEQTELERVMAAEQDAIDCRNSARRRKAMRRTVEFLSKVADAHRLDPMRFTLTIASDWRGVRVRYEQRD